MDRISLHTLKPSAGLSLGTLAWLAALLPFITIHATYLIAASYGHVEWCVPYWDSCTSISATGRQLPEKLVFKIGMMPAALEWLMALMLNLYFAGLALLWKKQPLRLMVRGGPEISE